MKKWRISLFSLTSLASLPLTSLVGCGTPESKIPVESVSLSEDSIKCLVGQTYKKLYYIITPEDATNQNVQWYSADQNVATVDKYGNITGIGKGTTSVTVKTEDGGFTASCNVTISEKVPVESVEIEGEEGGELYVSQTQQMKWKVLPQSATVKDVIWTSSDEKVATVSKTGKITAVGPGTATLTVASVDNPDKKDSYFLKVKEYIRVSEVKIKGEHTGTLRINDTKQMEWEVLPTTATNPKVKWESSNPLVAIVSDTGLITAVSSGTATITVTSEDDSTKKDSYALTVSKYVDVTSVKIQEGNRGTLIKGGTKQLSCKVLPEDATNPNVTWTSSNESVATVSETGKITTVSTGTATITVTSDDNTDIKDTYELTVVEEPTTVDDFETDPWLTVAYFANQGFDKLAKVYGHADDPEWFIGKERELEINGQTHKVRVVGIKQDYLDINHTQPVALTFRFENLISDNEGHCLRIEWESDQHATQIDYWNSVLNDALNSNENDVPWKNVDKEPVEEEQQISVYSMIRESEPFLADSIQTVYRGVNVGNVEEGWDLQSKPTKLFCPTISNLFSKVGIAASDEAYHIPKDRTLCYREGQPHNLENEDAQYKYFAKTDIIADQPIDDGDAWGRYFSCLHIEDCAQENAPNYWSGSPILTDLASIWITFIPNNDSGTMIESHFSIPFAVAPYFCI